MHCGLHVVHTNETLRWWYIYLFLFYFFIFHADVWLSQAKNVQEPGRLLHLSGQVLQLPFHWQQALWEGLQELFWVKVTCEHMGFFFVNLCTFFTNCKCFADWVKRDLEKSATPASSWWNGGKSFQWEPRRTGTTWVWITSPMERAMTWPGKLIQFWNSLLKGCGRQRRAQSKDNFQAQEDQEHLQESSAQSDQQTAERAEKTQWVSVWLWVQNLFLKKKNCIPNNSSNISLLPLQILMLTAPPPVPLRLSLQATATCQTTVQILSSVQVPAAPPFSLSWI